MNVLGVLSIDHSNIELCNLPGIINQKYDICNSQMQSEKVSADIFKKYICIPAEALQRVSHCSQLKVYSRNKHVYSLIQKRLWPLQPVSAVWQEDVYVTHMFKLD